MRNAKTLVVIVVLAGALIAAALIVGRSNGYSFTMSSAETPYKSANQNSKADEIPFFSAAFGSSADSEPEQKGVLVTTLSVVLRLMLAVILSGLLAFRPRKNFPLFQRNLSVSQTQILLAVVAAALMMIVGDNAARAFAIFAAVSLVRFRTNIRDPKEVTVLLISLALGLAAGVGRWELGMALCGFSLILLWFLEYNEQEQAFRSMELTVRSRNTDDTQNLLKKIFAKYKLDAEVRQLDPPDEQNPIGQIQYYLNLRLNLSTDHLSDKIMASDPHNIEGIQWAKTKSATDIYQ